MKYQLFLLVLCVISIPLKAQQANVQDYIVMPLEKAATYDYSHLWTLDTINYEHGDNILAFIGNDFQHMNIVFLSVTKNNTNPYQYNVSGKSKVKNNICGFKGTITIDTLIYNKTLDCDDIVELGSLKGSYKLYENSNQPHTGIFSGRFDTNFMWKDRNYWENCGDYSYNNMFTGTWTSYTTHKSKPCNWGNDRIPGNFPDNGAGDFSPDTTKAPSWKSYPEESQKYWGKFYSLFNKYYPNHFQNNEGDGIKRWGVIKKLMISNKKPWWNEL